PRATQWGATQWGATQWGATQWVGVPRSTSSSTCATSVTPPSIPKSTAPTTPMIAPTPTITYHWVCPARAIVRSTMKNAMPIGTPITIDFVIDRINFCSAARSAVRAASKDAGGAAVVVATTSELMLILPTGVLCPAHDFSDPSVSLRENHGSTNPQRSYPA